MDYNIYRLQRMLRDFHLKKISGYFKDFWFNAPDNTEAIKDNEETDRLIEDKLSGSTIL